MTPEHKRYLKKRKRDATFVVVFRIGILVVFVALWEILARCNVIDTFILSSPSRIVKILTKLYDDGTLLTHVAASLYETVMGFVIATVLGTVIAVLLWLSKGVRDVLEPYLITLNSLPKIALGPLLIVWLGTGSKSIIFMSVIICIVITIITMLSGFLGVDKEKIMLLRSMHAGKGKILTKLIFPANIPTLMSVLKINVGLSWIGSIMGEYLSSQKGLGYLLVYGSQVFQLDLVMASTVILCVLAGGMYGIVALAEKIVKKHF